MDWWSTKSAVRVSLVSSSTLLAFCLLAVLYTMSEIASFQQQTDDDLKEWKHYADEAWRQMTQLSLRRPRSAARRFAKRQNEYRHVCSQYQTRRSEYEPPQPAYYGGRDYYATPRHDQCNCAQQAQGCPAGLPGVPGLRGTDGEPGIPGQDGAPGANGVALNAYEQAQPGCIVCPPGPPGQQGKPGKLGDQGAPGLPGLPGYTPPPARPGPSGLCGDRGKPGQPGSPGRPGERGRDATCAIGLPGPKGVPGLTGPPGPPGNTGYTPPPGLPGPNGVGGPKGNDGLPGKPGLTGYPGPRGIPGQDAEYCPCPAKNRPKPYNSYVTAESAAYDTGHSSYVETSGYTAAKEEKEGEYRRRLLARVLKKQRRLVLTNRARNVRRKAVNPKLNTTPN